MAGWMDERLGVLLIGFCFGWRGRIDFVCLCFFFLLKHTCSNLFVGGDTTRHIFIGDCVNSSLCFISPIKNGFLLRLKRVEVVVVVVEDDGDVSG